MSDRMEASTVATELAEALRTAINGGSLTGVSYREALDGVSYQQAVEQLHGLNAAAAICYHIGYYLRLHNRVLEGGPLRGSDRESWPETLPSNPEAWEDLRESVVQEARRWADHVRALDAEALADSFGGTDRYGTVLHNLSGLVQHTQYHIGQLGLLRRLHGLPTAYVP